MFDFLSYVKDLESGGFQRQQAESQVTVVTRMFNENFATREGIATATLELHRDFSTLRDEFSEIRSEFGDLKGDLKSDFAHLKSEFAELKGGFFELKGEFRGEFKVIHAEFSKLSNDIRHIENRLLLKLGSLMIGLLTIGSAIISYVMKSQS